MRRQRPVAQRRVRLSAYENKPNICCRFHLRHAHPRCSRRVHPRLGSRRPPPPRLRPGCRRPDRPRGRVAQHPARADEAARRFPAGHSRRRAPGHEGKRDPVRQRPDRIACGGCEAQPQERCSGTAAPLHARCGGRAGPLVFRPSPRNQFKASFHTVLHNLERQHPPERSCDFLVASYAMGELSKTAQDRWCAFARDKASMIGDSENYHAAAQ